MKKIFVKKVETFLIAAIFGMAMIGYQVAYAQGAKDASITAQVKYELARAKDAPASKIHVETEKGVVLLSGFLENRKQKREAIKIAKSVKGVKEVKNGLVVLSNRDNPSHSTTNNESENDTDTASATDTGITTRIKYQLGRDNTVSGLDISVETYKGVALLSGFVKNDKEREAAVRIAKSVKGVKSVKNGLMTEKEVSASASKEDESRGKLSRYSSDSSITTKIKYRLAREEAVSALNISVETHKGIAMLSGFIRNDQEKKKAVEIAKKVEGVKTVKDNLVIMN